MPYKIEVDMELLKKHKDREVNSIHNFRSTIKTLEKVGMLPEGTTKEVYDVIRGEEYGLNDKSVENIVSYLYDNKLNHENKTKVVVAFISSFNGVINVVNV